MSSVFDSAPACRKIWLDRLRSGLTLWKGHWATSLLLASALGPVFAQPSPEANSVTDGTADGSFESWRSIAVINREDIEMSGILHLGELISSWANENGFGLERPQTLGYATLINGRDEASPVNLIPLSAVERIEIIGNGAAGMGDGVANMGAINIVLRRDYEGFEVTAMGGLPQGSGGSAEHSSILWGSKAGRGHLVMGFDSAHQSEIRTADRNYNRAVWSEGGRFADTIGVSVIGNTVLFPDEGGTVIRSVGDCSTDSGYTGVLLNPLGPSRGGEGCGFPWADVAWETDRWDRQSVFVNFDHPLGGATSLYVNGEMAWTDNLAAISAPTPGVVSVPQDKTTPELLATVGADAGPLTFYHRFLAHGNRESIEDGEMHNLAFGLQGQFQSGINWDLSVKSFRNTVTYDEKNFVSKPLAIEAVISGEYDIENPLSTDPIHRSAVDDISVTFDRVFVYDSMTARAALDGSGFVMPGGKMKWMAGFEMSSVEAQDISKYRDSSGQIILRQDVFGTGGGSSYEGQRSRQSGFAEVQLPPLPDWNVLLATEINRDDGDMTTGTLQVASSWQASEKLTLHGSWLSRSVPPSLGSLYALDLAVGYPELCDTKNHKGPAACDKQQYQTIRRSGNPDLQPSDSYIWTLGGVADLGLISLNANWFKVGSFNTLGRRSPQNILDREAEDGSSPLVTRENGEIIVINDTLLSNGESSESGFSLSGHTDWKAGPWTSGLDVHWAYIADDESKVDGVVQPGSFSRHRVHAKFRVGQGDVTAAWHTRFISGRQINRKTTRFAPWIGHNLTLEWQNAFAMEGLVFQSGVINLANRGPSVDPSSPDSFDRISNADAIRGRTFFLRAKLAW